MTTLVWKNISSKNNIYKILSLSFLFVFISSCRSFPGRFNHSMKLPGKFCLFSVNKNISIFKAVYMRREWNWDGSEGENKVATEVSEKCDSLHVLLRVKFNFGGSLRVQPSKQVH